MPASAAPLTNEPPADVRPVPTPQDLAVLRVLVERAGKVTGRHDLNRLAGLAGSERRCEAALVLLRRILGYGAIVTIRRRGWMLTHDATPAALALLDSYA